MYRARFSVEVRYGHFAEYLEPAGGRSPRFGLPLSGRQTSSSR